MAVCMYTLRDLIEDTDRNSIDLIDDYDERTWVCVEPGYKLTDYCLEKYADVLALEVMINHNWYVPAHLCIDEAVDSKECDRLSAMAYDLLWSLAGYCDEDEFNKLFIETEV